MKKKFSWRSFISFGLFISFFIILFSGVILYIAPAGRVANWTNWKLIGFSKTDWQSVQTVFSYTFVILSLFHLFSINRKAFLTHIRSKTKKGLYRKTEMITSVTLTLVIFFGVVYGVPPFRTVMDWGDKFTERWEKEETTPPIPHAGSYSLEKFAQEILKMPVDSALKKLESNNIFVDSAEQTIADISKVNRMAPRDLYEIFETSDREVVTVVSSAVVIPGGNGVGRKTLKLIGVEYNIPAEKLTQALEKAGIVNVTTGSVLKDLAGENNTSPSELLDILNNRDE